METEQEQKKIERLAPPIGEMINTWINCPYREENIRTRERVIKGVDYQSGLCPERCPMSPRNSDYSNCSHKGIDPFEGVRGCRIGLPRWDSGVSVFAHWCEATVIGGLCPLQFTR